MAHVKLHFAKRASASGTHLFPDLSYFRCKYCLLAAAGFDVDETLGMVRTCPSKQIEG